MTGSPKPEFLRGFPQARVLKRTGTSICGLPVVVDETMPPNRLDVIDAKGKTVARIENLAASPVTENKNE